MNISSSTAGDAPKTAILFTDDFIESTKKQLGVSSALLPLLDRPILQWVMEHLVLSGCQLIHIVLGDTPLPIRNLLQDGKRWGCRLVYHPPCADESFSQLMRRMNLLPDQHYTLAQANCLPYAADSMPTATLESQVNYADVWQENDRTRWIGWGDFTGAWLLAQDSALDADALENTILSNLQLTQRLPSSLLSTRTPAALVDSNSQLLAQALATGTPTQIGRGSTIHPSVQILPPAYIGEQVKIAEGAVIGPNVVIGNGALIDREAHLQTCVILPNTYVGEALELNSVVAANNLLANIRLDTVVKLNDPHLLSRLTSTGRTVGSIPRREKLLALALYVALFPLQLMSQLRAKNSTTNRINRVTLTSIDGHGEIELALNYPEIAVKTADMDWSKHFRHTFYPGLREVVRGNLSLQGPTLRSPTNIRHLTPMWQLLYAESCPGLLNEALLQNMQQTTLETQFASDAIASASQGKLASTLPLLGKYLSRVARHLIGYKGKQTVTLTPLATDD